VVSWVGPGGVCCGAGRKSANQNKCPRDSIAVSTHVKRTNCTQNSAARVITTYFNELLSVRALQPNPNNNKRRARANGKRNYEMCTGKKKTMLKDYVKDSQNPTQWSAYKFCS